MLLFRQGIIGFGWVSSLFLCVDFLKLFENFLNQIFNSKSKFSPEIATITTPERFVIVNDLSMKCQYSRRDQRDIQWNVTTIATSRPKSNGQTILSKSFWTSKIRPDRIFASFPDRTLNNF